jgi:acetylornithine deacetylase/succinyl-diaminopimelate desuccinylase-like protein
MLDTVLLWITKNEKRWLADLKSWLAIPSVSAQTEHDSDTRLAAEWVADRLGALGMRAQIISTPRHPCVLATTPDDLCASDAPHVLLYGHYDVQPPEPLDLWQTPPFAGEVRDGQLFARGASDDKGQVHAHIAALTAWREIDQRFPCRVTMLLEGEEEIGSPNLMAVIREHAAELRAARIVLISDSNQFAAGVPAITVGLRGLVYFQITVTAANSDLHSGLYGGAVANAANVLVDVLGKLHDAQGRVTIPGFYDDVQAVSAEEARMWKTLPFDEADYLRGLGLRATYGEAGYSTLTRQWARPTLEINGLTSGYQGPGAKTVLPCLASAKVSCRLVPNQDPRKIAAAFKAHLSGLLTQAFGAAAQIQIEELGAGSPPALTPTDSPAMRAGARALEIGFGTKPIFMRDGGSIPVVNWFKETLGLDTIMVGFGLPDDHIHAPNEKIDLANYYAGVRTVAALYDELGRVLT